MMQHLDIALITAFVERWQPDTNTFHMPFGEMSILLHDVHHILRIPVEGELMRDDPHPDVLKLDMHDLVRVPVDGPVGGKWKSKWFLNGGIHAEGLLVRGREMKIRDLEVQTYLFVLLGSTLFVDKSLVRNLSFVHLSMLLFSLVHCLVDITWGDTG
ncbi:unnamed protein product [Linum tenue]|uniref:Aminotransferase-like plant mobile domain-containing protein n=1 Tax=Linum tenue TaxID=586396 RepID=A0AAV0M9L9_9ROSI|nr:unnamed protein product [Linum tenue]